MNKSLIIMLLAAIPAAAQTLSPEQSLRRVTNKEYTLSSSGRNYYVFTNAESTLITSAAKTSSPVIARLDAPMSQDEMPPAMQWLLSQYDAQAAAPSATSAENYAKWTPIEPIMQCKWNQGKPYNNLCPSGTSTGCVATAMAQVIYTNRHAVGAGSISYTDYAGHKVSFDFSSAKFNFDAMTPTYDSKSSAEACDAVAELMYACGASVQMTYGPESGATPQAVAPALANNFGYDPDYTMVLWRPQFQTSEWEKILYNELKAGRPVFYGGAQPSGSSHAFVVDGYADNGLFHINWGWSGSSDGYFSLAALNPYDKTGAGADNGFNGSQYAVLAIRPDAKDIQYIDFPDDMEVPDLSGCKIVDLNTGGDVYIGRESQVSFTIVNSGKVDFNDFIHLGVYNEDNEEVCYVERMNTIVASGDASKFSMTIKMEGEKELLMYAGKTYKLRVQDHWHQTLGEISFIPKEGTPTDQWSSEGLSFYVSNAMNINNGVVMTGENWSHNPAIYNMLSQNVDLKLTFYEQGTDNVVATVAGFSGNMNMMYGREFNWSGKRPKIDLGMGVYDMCYTNGTTQCSPRICVRVGFADGSINYAPVAGRDHEVEVAAGNYSGAITIPESTMYKKEKYKVSAIGDNAFEMTGVTSLDMPAGIEAMGLRSLRLTHSLKNIAMHSTVPPFASKATFTYGLYHGCAIHVPAESVEAYGTLLAPHPVYALAESLDAPTETVDVVTGKETTVKLGVTPASIKFNPGCTLRVAPRDAVSLVGSVADSEGNIVLTIRGEKAGEATVTVTPDQPGLAAVKFTVKVSDESAISEIAAENECETEYYNLQGIKVITPRKGGIYVTGSGKTVRL